jgi:hypothetical protein
MTFAIGQRVFLKMTFKYFKIGHVEHWLNGYKVVEFDIWTHEWKKWVPIANSIKFPVLVLVKKDTSRYKIMVMVSGIEILR